MGACDCHDGVSDGVHATLAGRWPRVNYTLPVLLKCEPARAGSHFWDIRRDATKNRSGHPRELAAFGWWAASGKFDESWALDQLSDLLSHADKVTPDGQVLPWLANVATRRTHDAVRCLDLIAEHCNLDFRLEVWNGHVVSILRAALRSPEPETRQPAQALIDRLGSRGLQQFRSLREPDGGSEQC
jgi:hypothetical protein